MTLAIVYLVDGFKILVVRLRQIGRGAGQSKWVHGNGRSFANGRFNPPSGDYKSDCEYRDADAEQGAHVRSPLRFQTRCWSRIVPDVHFHASSTCAWYRANVAALLFCIVCIWLG